MNVILTGGNGYIGENLLKYNKEHNMIVIDKKLGNDIMDIDSFPIDWREIDVIVHLAALSGIIDCENDVDLCIRDNILTTKKLIDVQTKLGLKNNLKKPLPFIIFASSQSTKNPDSKYAYSKLVCEKMLLESDYRNIILKFANIYGGHSYEEKKNSVIAKFRRAIRNNEPLVINGDGKQKRDFIHVFDVCEAIMKCLKIDCKNVDTYEKVYDIGYGIGTSIVDLALNCFNTDNVKFNKDSRTVGSDSSIADAALFEEKFNWKPKFKLEESVWE